MTLRNLAAWLSLALMVMACPPFSWSIEAIFFTMFLVWLAAENHWWGWQSTKWGTFSSALALVMVLTLTAVELSHRRMPLIGGVLSDHLVVIGIPSLLVSTLVCQHGQLYSSK